MALRYQDDPRKGVQHALKSAIRQEQLRKKESLRLDGLYSRLDQAPPQATIVGLDEVGRGALAGPLLFAAVVLPPHPRIEGLDDSKRLTARQREVLSTKITELAAYIGFGWVEASDINRFGMAAALRQAAHLALSGLEPEPDLVLLDGRPLGIHPRETAIVHGDASEAAIAAASIVAKVARDAFMTAAAADYPGYGLAANKGYASAEHIAALRSLGPSAIHRLGFCEEILGDQQRLF